MTTPNTTSQAQSIAETDFAPRHPRFSFFMLAVDINWLISLPALLFELPFKPFQTAGAYGSLFAAQQQIAWFRNYLSL